MPAHPARAAPPPEPDSPIAPYQLWRHLSVGQQQHVRTVLIRVAQQLLAQLPSQPLTEETTYDPRSQLKPSETCIPHIVVRVGAAMFVKTYPLAMLTLIGGYF